MHDDAATRPHPTPEARAKGEPAGTPVAFGDGNAWTLADYVPRLEPVWDRIYDDNIRRGVYSPEHIRIAAWLLLRENYELTADEAAELIVRSGPAAMVPAIETALFPMPALSVERTFSRWAESALWSAGIDPETVPARIRNEVLEHLEYSGRVVPRAEFMGASRASIHRALLLKNAAQKCDAGPADAA